jgi:hypothetical protein
MVKAFERSVMSATSVGTGTPNDSNENTAPDSLPSKTLGAESGPDAENQGGIADSPDCQAEPPETESDLLSAQVAPASASPHAAYPDGPNVAPSPDELSAAQGQA